MTEALINMQAGLPADNGADVRPLCDVLHEEVCRLGCAGELIGDVAHMLRNLPNTRDPNDLQGRVVLALLAALKSDVLNAADRLDRLWLRTADARMGDVS